MNECILTVFQESLQMLSSTLAQNEENKHLKIKVIKFIVITFKI
jgi:hypothetical protein